MSKTELSADMAVIVAAAWEVIGNRVTVRGELPTAYGRLRTALEAIECKPGAPAPILHAKLQGELLAARESALAVGHEMANEIAARVPDRAMTPLGRRMYTAHAELTNARRAIERDDHDES